jgi:hypothetical protein
LMWQNKRHLFSLLFEASAATLLDVAADSKLLGSLLHVLMQRWKSFGGKWAPLATKLARLPVGGSLDLPDYPSDAASRSGLRGDVGALLRRINSGD